MWEHGDTAVDRLIVVEDLTRVPVADKVVVAMVDGVAGRAGSSCEGLRELPPTAVAVVVLTIVSSRSTPWTDGAREAAREASREAR